ncbi:uncharacterized protein PV07_12743 [Cladophialophora immunda]|uniref:Uncharacterized protein n=1 Tax=Cladophialophora immunda TaxID=569365 RepID=A0A0D2BRZ5_9EURO|nr:uncharacterized protein PV07_12743 [Cladophialophora immunda]KIW21833.1 hypothetical protein PV07_12743 [Cladophialophora immunda]
MAGSSDHQERLLATSRLLDELVYKIARIPHDFCSVMTPIQAFGVFLKQCRRATDLQLAVSAIEILDRMHEFCDALRDDITQSRAPDWEAFKSQGRDIDEISSALEPLSTAFCAAIVEANPGRFAFTEDAAARFQASIEDALQHEKQRQKELEDKLNIPLRYKFVRILIEADIFMARLLDIVVKDHQRRIDLQADAVTLNFLADNISWITDVEILIPIIARWRDLINNTTAAIKAQDAKTTAIRKLTNSSRLLRATVVSYILSNLYRSARVSTSRLVLENCREMISDQRIELKEHPITDSSLDKNLLATCSAICQRAENELPTLSPNDKFPPPHFLLSTWDEYFSQHEADALRLLSDKMPFEVDRLVAYRNLRQSENTKEKRLFDLAQLLGEDVDVQLDLESGPVTVLTEGSLHNSEGILNELKERVTNPPSGSRIQD